MRGSRIEVCRKHRIRGSAITYYITCGKQTEQNGCVGVISSRVKESLFSELQRVAQTTMHRNDANTSKHSHGQFGVQSTSDETYPTRPRRTDFAWLLKNWFDPRPQLKEMHQVVFWKDMVVEGMALGYILIPVILLLNACKLVSDYVFFVCVCLCVWVFWIAYTRLTMLRLSLINRSRR